MASATVYHSKHDGQQAPNARLIAAAPELLAALQALLKAAEWAEENKDSPHSAIKHFMYAAAEARAAIAKALGA
ncbi:hypothetical protein VZ52_13395 [Ralstonia mannitolilytica]|nr:hypothetical protein VZ52_13395 [Ralstonia mannitolilytica]